MVEQASDAEYLLQLDGVVESARLDEAHVFKTGPLGSIIEMNLHAKIASIGAVMKLRRLVARRYGPALRRRQEGRRRAHL